MNSLVHRIEIGESTLVESVYGLESALSVFKDAAYVDLTGTYVVERVREYLSDGSVKCSIRIREVERVS